MYITTTYFCNSCRYISKSCKEQSYNKCTICNEAQKKINEFEDDIVLSIVAENKCLLTALTCIDHFKCIPGLETENIKTAIIKRDSITYLDFTLLSRRDLKGAEGKCQSIGINLSVETGDNRS